MGIDWSQSGSSTDLKSQRSQASTKDQDKEKTSNSKEEILVIARGRCWTGALKQTLEPIGSLVLVFLDSEI